MAQSRDDPSTSSAPLRQERMFKCLCSIDDVGTQTRYLSADALMGMLHDAHHFDINITTMPLAQHPKHHLKLLFKFMDAQRDEVWVRIDLPADITAQLLTGMLREWQCKF